MDQPIITLDPEEQLTGVLYSGQARQARALAEAADAAERTYMAHLRRTHNVPADWVLVDWTVGFMPHPEGHEHGNHQH